MTPQEEKTNAIAEISKKQFELLQKIQQLEIQKYIIATKPIPKYPTGGLSGIVVEIGAKDVILRNGQVEINRYKGKS